MNGLEIIGVLAILAVAFVIVMVFAGVVCQPTMANNAIARMGNRASRELEQTLYKFASGIVGLILLIVVCAIFGR